MATDPYTGQLVLYQQLGAAEVGISDPQLDVFNISGESPGDLASAAEAWPERMEEGENRLPEDGTPKTQQVTVNEESTEGSALEEDLDSQSKPGEKEKTSVEEGDIADASMEEDLGVYQDAPLSKDIDTIATSVTEYKTACDPVTVENVSPTTADAAVPQISAAASATSSSSLASAPSPIVHVTTSPFPVNINQHLATQSSPVPHFGASRFLLPTQSPHVIMRTLPTPLSSSQNPPILRNATTSVFVTLGGTMTARPSPHNTTVHVTGPRLMMLPHHHHHQPMPQPRPVPSMLPQVVLRQQLLTHQPRMNLVRSGLMLRPVPHHLAARPTATLSSPLLHHQLTLAKRAGVTRYVGQNAYKPYPAAGR